MAKANIRGSWFRNLLSLQLSLFVLISCSGDSPVGPESDTNEVVSVFVITGRRYLVGAGAELQLNAFAANSAGSKISGKSFQWASSNPAVATVNSTGLVTTLGHGTVTISATTDNIKGELEFPVISATGQGIALIDDEAGRFIFQNNVPGGAYAVVRNGRLVHARGYGLADLTTEEVVEPTDLFRIASVSKPITGVATLKLVQDGLLSLEDKAFEILAGLVPAEGPADSSILDITIDQLLHHTAGWNRSRVADPMFRQREIARDLGVPSPPDAEMFVRWLLAEPLQFTPGAAFAFHNVTYLVLGRVIEQVTGLSYEAYVQHNVFAAMGITTARIGRTKESDRAENEVTYYSPGLTDISVFDDDPVTTALPYGPFGAIEPMDSHGGWIASVVDLARFAVAVDGDPSTPEFLSSEMQQFMITNPGFGYSAGWFLSGNDWYHSGGLPGTASILWSRADGITVIAVFNQTGSNNFYNDFVFGLLAAVDINTEWPEWDLFEEYP